LFDLVRQLSRKSLDRIESIDEARPFGVRSPRADDVLVRLAELDEAPVGARPLLQEEYREEVVP
jgi:hypothetical protein